MSNDKELDSLTTAYMDNLAKILELTKYLETNLADGRFNLSKARYCLGNQDSVSPLQYNLGELNAPALTQVAIRSSATSTEENGDKEEETAQIFSEPNWNEFSIVSKDNNEIKTTEMNKVTQRDPLKWFGILVPQSLRQAQREFQRSLRIICELAERKDRLINLRKCIKDKASLALTTEQLRELMVKD